MSAYWKDLFREIKNTPGRFISFIIITTLGAASVVGIQATAIDMRNIADKTYKEHSLYDLQLKSTMGFDDNDITALSDTAGVTVVMPTNIYDVFINIENENRAVRTYALPDELNTIHVIDGRLPNNSSECVVEHRLQEEGNIKIGDSIKLSLDDMGNYFDVFADDTFTVVGVVSSPLYISFQRGNTALGDGSMRYYLYLHPDAYNLDVYTDVYILMDGSHEMDNLTEDYYNAADGWKRKIEKTGDLRVQVIKDDLVDAQNKIDDGWAEYNNGMKTLEKETTDARRKLADAKVKLDDAKTELENGQKKLNAEIANGLKELDKQALELANGQKELNKQRTELDAGHKQISEERKQLKEYLAALALQGPQGVSPELDAYYEQVYAGLRELDVKEKEIDTGKATLAAAQKKLDDGVKQIGDARADLERERKKAQSEIDDGWEEYNKGLKEYNDGIMTLETEESDTLAELTDAKQELEDAQEKLDKAPGPEWFVFTRKDGVAFDSYYQDTLRIEKIGYVFPLVFFLVAIMVSLTSMSRMVENHRTQIGIYKALGYRPFAILMKYLIYAFSASVTGGIIGIIFGSWLFPVVVTDAYGHIYQFPSVDTPIPTFIAVIAVLSSVLAVVVVTLATYIGSMKGNPALLMRPKPPAKGKRVLLERIPLLWKRFGFFTKVTARNVFRYKKRVIMTLAGVAGCSALLLTGFGLSDSIGAVADMQYENIVQYDMRAYLKDIKMEEQKNELNSILSESHLFVREEMVTASGEKGNISASLFIPGNPENLADFINLYSAKTIESIPMTSNSVLLTDKMSQMIGVSAGDNFTITLVNGKTFTAEITGIVENYLNHYIYMSPSVYTELFEEEPYPNNVIIFSKNMQELSSSLLENDNVRAVVQNDKLLSIINESTDAMGVVTVVLIVLACALALVVLFNLTNINISERIRELATIKVLGFNDKEMAMYIYRENGIVTLLGILLGLVGGIFLHAFVLTSVEVDILKFPLVIYPHSYILSVGLSAAFAVFVNFVMSYKLMRIDMVESLKAVE